MNLTNVFSIPQAIRGVLGIFTWICFGISPLFAQPTPSVVGNFPNETGVVFLDAQGNILSFIPIAGNPTDIEILPTLNQFAVVTLNGELLIYTGEGQQVFSANFEPLNDIDCIDNDANRFLLTSRTGKRVFIFNRENEDQTDIPFPCDGPVDADLLPSGNLLLCDAQMSRIVEITDRGQLIWSYESDLKQPMDALRLPDGRTMIADFDNHRVLVVTADGGIVKQYRGYDHPSKLVPLPTGAVLVADADQQEIEEISLLGEKRVIRGQLNCVQSVAFLPGQNFYLCAIQKKFLPPVSATNLTGKTENTSLPSTGVPISSPATSSIMEWFLNRYLLLTIALFLGIFFMRTGKHTLIARIAFLVSYGLILVIAWGSQTQAAATPDHRPDYLLGLGTLFLAILVFRDASDSFWPKERWLESDNTWRIPFARRDFLLLGILSFAAFLAQYFYLRPMPVFGRLPWYVPMAVWGFSLFILYRCLFQKSPREGRDHSLFQFGPVMVAVPFSTGSVTFDDIDEDRSSSQESPQNTALVESWGNTIFILILIIAAAMYFIGATSIPTDVHGDEAEVALYGMQVRDTGNWNFFNVGWYKIPHLFFLIPAWVMWFFGDNVFGVRIAGGLIGIACIPVFYLLSRRLLRSSAATIATFLFATSSVFVHFSRIGIGYNQTTLFALAVFYGFVRAVQDREARWLSFAGAIAAIGMLSYQANQILAPLVVSSLGLLWITRALAWRGLIKGLFAFFFAFWIGFAPMVGVFCTDSGAAFSRARSVTLFSPEGKELMKRGYSPEITYPQLIKIQVERSLLAPITHHDNSPYLINRVYGGMLDPLPAILFLAGLFLLIGMFRHPVSRLLIYWMLCFLLIGSALTDHAPSYQRLVGLIPLLLLVAAPVLNGCLIQAGRVFRWTPKTRLHFTSAVLVIFLLFGMNRYFHQIMSKPQMLDEWTRIARYLDDSGTTPYTYFFGPPNVYFQYGTLRFVAQNAKGEDVMKPDEFLKKRVTRRGPVCFLLVRNNRRYISELRQIYPGGREENHFNLEGGAPFTTYVVDF